MRDIGIKGALLAILAVSVLAIVAVISPSAPAPGQGPGQALTPAQALAVDDSSAIVTVRGMLTNAGTNFFTDARIVITDPRHPGEKLLIVQPWLPAEAYQPPRSGESRPPVMSDFLGKEVVLTGQIEVRPVRGAAPAKTLIVKDAELVKK